MKKENIITILIIIFIVLLGVLYIKKTKTKKVVFVPNQDIELEINHPLLGSVSYSDNNTSEEYTNIKEISEDYVQNAGAHGLYEGEENIDEQNVQNAGAHGSYGSQNEGIDTHPETVSHFAFGKTFTTNSIYKTRKEKEPNTEYGEGRVTGIIVFSQFYEVNEVVTIMRPGTGTCETIGNHLYCENIDYNGVISAMYADSSRLSGIFNEIAVQLRS